MTSRRAHLHTRQRGAATLVVVMVLFLVMALLAAYANRSMLFEQRMASSYLRAGLAQETAEAGVEWVLAQLNGPAINNACIPVSNGGQRFVDRYLQIDPADRSVTPFPVNINGVVDCARDPAHQGWACRCPNPSTTRNAAPLLDTGDLPPSSFVVYKLDKGARAGTLQLQIQSCTDSVVDNCLFASGGGTKIADLISKAQIAKSRVGVLIGFVSAVRNPPASPLVVTGSITSSGTGLGLHNTDARSNGMLAVYGGTWPDRVDSRLESVPGTAIPQVVAQDSSLGDLYPTPDLLFQKYLGANAASYQDYPAVRVVNCSSDCSGDLQTAYNAGQRILWVNGPMTISRNVVLGTSTAPLLVIATGNVTLTGAFQFNGMIATQGNLNWTNNSGAPSLVNGMVLVGGNMQTAGAMDIVYQQGIADQLRNRLGSYVRASGSWFDS